MALLGAARALAATGIALAYRLAPTPVVGVFDTSYLGFAALWGAVLFDDLPTATAAAGIGLIAGGAILMSRRAAGDGARSAQGSRRNIIGEVA